MLRSSLCLSHSIRLLACVAVEKLLSCLHAIFLYMCSGCKSRILSTQILHLRSSSFSISRHRGTTDDQLNILLHQPVCFQHLSQSRRKEREKNHRHFISGDRLKCPALTGEARFPDLHALSFVSSQQRTSDTDCATVTLAAIKCTKAKTGQSAKNCSWPSIKKYCIQFALLRNNLLVNSSSFLKVM
jgi:hypothetical protein